MRKLVVLSGAGISAESGIKTFRDADGLWEGHDVMEVATPQGWDKDYKLVLDFYNQRRRQLKEVKPNPAHLILAELENEFDIQIITQNVDDLHERAGSSKVLHLHGELLKARSTKNSSDIQYWAKDILPGDLCKLGHQMRPHIVWFGEAVPALDEAIKHVKKADIILIIGTSLQVYPAASLFAYASKSIPLYYIDPKPFMSPELKLQSNYKIIDKTASEGMLFFKDLHIK